MNVFINFGNLLTHFMVIISFIFQTASGIFIQPRSQSSTVNLTVSKSAALVDDLNSDSKLNLGEQLEYSVTIENSGDTDALGVQVLDTLDSNFVWDGQFKSTPLCYGDAINTNEDTPITVNLTALDADGQNLSFEITELPQHGSLGSVQSNGAQSAQVIYSPNADYTGSDSFRFHVIDEDNNISNIALVTLEVHEVNDPPTADSQSISTDEDTAKVLTLTGSDPESQPLSFVVVDNPAYGNLSGTTPDLLYTPDENYFGTDQFTFKTNDGNSDSALATVSITINAVNDQPVANAQSVTTDEDTPKTITLTGSDPEGSTLTYVMMSNPSNGILSGTAPNLTYTPNENFNGSDSFTFKTNDGDLDSEVVTVSITINAVNDQPIANTQSISTDEDTPKTFTLTGSDPEGSTITYGIVSNPSNGLLSGTAPNLTYTPNENFNGSDSFTFKTNDGDLDSEVVTVSITINAVNDQPVANAQSVTTDEDTPKTITLAGSDPEGSTLTYVMMSIPSNGLLSGTAPNMTYTPNENFNGSDSFTFKTSDGDLDSEVVTVSITINAVNDQPVAIAQSNAQSVITNEDHAVNIVLSANDVDNDPLTYNIVVEPGHGELTGTAPNLTYTPDENYCGTDQFTFKVNDGSADSNTAAVDLIINCVNDAPTAGDDMYETVGNTPLYVGVPLNGAIGITDDTLFLENDSDSVEGTTISILSVNTTETSGTVTWNADGSFVYTPAVGFTGDDSFTYQICDQGSPLPIACSTGTVTITVGPTVIWYVNAAAAAGGNGSSTAPFQNLNPLNNDGTDADQSGDVIYLYHNVSAYSGPLTLETNQQLIGSGTALTALGQTLILAGTNPTLSNSSGSGVTLANGVILSGLTFTNIRDYAIVGNNYSGVLDLSQVTLGNAGKHLFSFTGGAPQITFNQILNNTTGGVLKAQNLLIGNSFVFNQSINGNTLSGTDEYLFDLSGGVYSLDVHQGVVNTAGGLIKINSASSGSNFVFDKVVTTTGGGIVCTNSTLSTLEFKESVNLGSSSARISDTSAFVLNNCDGTINFSTINIYTSTKSAVDIQNSKTVTITGGIIDTTSAADYGMRMTGTSAGDTIVNAVFTNVNISGTTRSGIETLGSYDIPTNDGTGDGIFVNRNGGSLTINGGSIINNADDGVDIRYSSGLILNNMTFTNNGTGARPKVASVKVIDLSGTTNLISGCAFNNFDTINAAAVSVINSTVSSGLTISNSTFSNAPTQGSGVRAFTVNGGRLDLTINNNTTFQNIYGAAVSMNANSTLINSLTIQNTTFQNAPANGFNGISAQSLGNSTFNVNLSSNTITNIASSLGLASVMLYAADGSIMHSTISANNVTALSYSGLSVDYAQTTNASASSLTLTGNTWGNAVAPIGTTSNDSGIEISFSGNSKANLTQTGDVVYMTGSYLNYAEEISMGGTSRVVVDLDNNQFTQVNSTGLGAWRMTTRDTAVVCSALDGNVFTQTSLGVQYEMRELDTTALSVVNYPTLTSRNTGSFSFVGTITETGFCSLVVMDNLQGSKVAAMPIKQPRQETKTQLDVNVGTIPAGASVEITFIVQLADDVLYGTEIVNNQAVVSGSNFGQILSDDPSEPGSEDVTVFPIDLPEAADLSVSQTLIHDTEPGVGDSLTWEIVVTNHGPSISTGGTLTTSFTSGLVWNIVPDACVPGEVQFVCSLPLLSINGSTTFTFETVINPGVQSNNTFTSLVEGSVPDLDSENNQANNLLVIDSGFEIPGLPITGSLPVAESPNGNVFYGEFGNESIELAYLNLPAHTQLELSFDLVIIRSWDGTGERYEGVADLNIDDEKGSFGPDLWQISVEDGSLLTRTTFANWPSKLQSYPDRYEQGSYAPKTGANAVNSWGYEVSRGGDATYHLNYPLLHNQESITFVLSAEGLEDLANESWGITNVELRLTNLVGGSVIYLPLIQK